MLLRILKNSFLKRPKSAVLVLFSVSLGASVATAFLGIQREIGTKMAMELRSYGANILVEPAVAGVAGGGYLKDSDLPKIKTVFWKHNITGFAPFLYGAAELAGPAGKERAVLAGTWFQKPLEVEGEAPSAQGVKVIAPWWQVAGGWPAAPEDAVVGAALARRLGLTPGVELVARAGGKEARFRVAGVVTTGSYEEEQVFVPLQTAQEFLNRPGAVSRVLVSALTVPMDDFGRKDPSSMSKLDYEKWYCTAYVTSVAKNLEEAISGSRAKPIWRIASAEGALLSKLNTAMLILTLLALVSSAIGVSTSLMASMAERRKEIALMKAVGADRLQIVLLFLAEAMIIALLGGVVGYIAGNRLASLIGTLVFAASLKAPLWLLPISIGSALAVALAGSAGPVRKALVVETVKTLKQ